jgi:hypothetical protein
MVLGGLNGSSHLPLMLDKRCYVVPPSIGGRECVGLERVGAELEAFQVEERGGGAGGGGGGKGQHALDPQADLLPPGGINRGLGEGAIREVACASLEE